jgi:hypothetical protein
VAQAVVQAVVQDIHQAGWFRTSIKWRWFRTSIKRWFRTSIKDVVRDIHQVAVVQDIHQGRGSGHPSVVRDIHQVAVVQDIHQVTWFGTSIKRGSGHPSWFGVVRDIHQVVNDRSGGGLWLSSSLLSWWMFLSFSPSFTQLMDVPIFTIFSSWWMSPSFQSGSGYPRLISLRNSQAGPFARAVVCNVRYRVINRNLSIQSVNFWPHSCIVINIRRTASVFWCFS